MGALRDDFHMGDGSMPETGICYLCGQIHGASTRDLIASMLPDEPYARRVLLETPSFAVIPSLGPLVDGHVLLCPRSHFRSFAEIPRELHAEHDAVKATVRSLLREVYGRDVHVFEHGTGRASDRTLCTVDHAHTHLVPLPDTAIRHTLSLNEWVPFDGTLGTLASLTSGHEYVAYEEPDGTARVRVAIGGVESQYMRRVVARCLGKVDDWNWRVAPDARAADATWRRCVSSGLRPALGET